MPPLPRLRTPALADLARQLRYAPAEALRRHVEHAEALAGEVEASRNYPEDWVVFRVTGYRPELAEPAMIVGSALLTDLSALVERLSDAAQAGESGGAATGSAGQLTDLDPGAALDIDALCRRWRVSRKTIDRYRKQGLIARRAVGGNGKARLIFTLAAVERFERRAPARIAGAGAFTRIPPELEARMVRRAARYRRVLGCSLNAAAARLATRFDRAHETVRQLLHRHEKSGAVFGESGPLTDRQRGVLHRAWRRGIDASTLGARFRRTRPTIHRAINERRAELLRGLALPEAPSVAKGNGRRPRPGASETVLAPTPVRSGLGTPGETDLSAFLRGAREPHVPIGVEEAARGAAHQFLLAEAARLVHELPAHQGGGAPLLDRVETSLRWAARLKAELVRTQLNLLVRTLEGQLGTPLDTLRPGELRALICEGLAAIGAAVDQHDPAKGGRLAAPAGIALARVAPTWLRERQKSRLPATRPGVAQAASHLTPGAAIPDWTLTVAPWQAWLEPDPRLRAAARQLPDPLGALLVERFGWGGEPPMTIAEIATRRAWSHVRAVRTERRAIREGLRMARGDGRALNEK